MKISKVTACSNHILEITTEEGKIGYFDVTPYLESEVFHELKDKKKFKRIYNGGYFLEWDCGADLSADTIEAYLSSKFEPNAQRTRIDRERNEPRSYPVVGRARQPR